MASLKIEGPSRGSGIELSSTCMRKRRIYSRCSVKLPCLEMIHAPRLYQALRDTPRVFPPWANPKTGSAPANGVDATPRRCSSVNGGDQIRARASDPAPVYSPGDSWAPGTKNTCSISETRQADGCVAHLLSYGADVEVRLKALDSHVFPSYSCLLTQYLMSLVFHTYQLLHSDPPHYLLSSMDIHRPL